jgi:polyisoprenyl-teichoic acid--peptidoglycan teichoic acid transferase
MIPRNRLIWILLVSVLVLIMMFPGVPTWAQQATETREVTPNPVGGTPTPFQPLPPTPTYIPTAFPTPVPTATPAPPPTQPSPPDPEDFGPVNHPQDQVNILLMGSDQRLGEIGFRTDTIILLSINTRKLTASMVSFPRDLYLYLPGYTYNRINTAMYFGGFPLLVQTFEQHFGVNIDHYILVGLDAFMETIDSLGGIAVEAGETLTDFRTGVGDYTVPAGEFLMDGTTALWYVRARYSTSDFDRTRRQQEVIVALAKRLLSMNGLENADELYDIYHRNVSTDLKWLDLAPLVPVLARIGDPDNIQHYYVGRGHVIPWTTPGGAMVLLPQEYAIKSVLQQAVGTP